MVSNCRRVLAAVSGAIAAACEGSNSATVWSTLPISPWSMAIPISIDVTLFVHRVDVGRHVRARGGAVVLDDEVPSTLTRNARSSSSYRPATRPGPLVVTAETWPVGRAAADAGLAVTAPAESVVGLGPVVEVHAPG